MKYYLFNHRKGQQYYTVGGDIASLFLAVTVSYSLRIFLNNDWHLSFALLAEKFTPWLLLVLVPHLFSLYLLGLYNLQRLISRFRLALLLVFSVLLAGLFIGAIFFFFPRYIFGRQVLLIHLVVSSAFLVCWRLGVHDLGVRREKPRKLALIGSLSRLEQYLAEIRPVVGSSAVVSGVCVVGGGEIDDPTVRRYGSIGSLLTSGAFDILLYDPLCNSFDPQDIQQIMEKKYQGKVVFDFPSFYKNLTGRIPLEYIDGNWLLQQEGLQGFVSKPYIYMKRLLDLSLACCLLAIFFPAALLVALLIRLESKGPVLYAQERVGLHGVPFTCLKFRTMIHGAERETGPTWAMNQDHRVTRIGRFLRKSRLDEIPQLWNIIRGDLSFVGPRPIRKFFVDKLSREVPYYKIRFNVQPGLSGWAQAHNCYAVPDGYRALEYELFYILNMSFFLDILTIVKTVKSVVRAEGR